MWQRLSIAGLLVALSSCVPLPPLPDDAAAKRFEPVAGRAVVLNGTMTSEVIR